MQGRLSANGRWKNKKGTGQVGGGRFLTCGLENFEAEWGDGGWPQTELDLETIPRGAEVKDIDLDFRNQEAS
jgi:hypothetical protein